MRTVDFETVLSQTIQAIGMDKTFITEETFNQIRDFADRRLKYGWEYDAFPDLIRITKFPVVNDGTLHYVVIPDDGVVSNSEGTFKVDIGTIMQVTVQDPRSTGSIKELAFSFDEYEEFVSGDVYKTVRRLILTVPDATEVYITYKKPCPDLIGDIYTTGSNYVPGQVVYWAYRANNYFSKTSGSAYGGKLGNFWKCIKATTSEPNSNNSNSPEASDSWVKVAIPAFFLHYLVKGIHSDWLMSEQMIQEGLAFDQQAIKLLDFEIQKLTVQQGQQPRFKFINPY
mgnify:CR=1 FL=1